MLVFNSGSLGAMGDRGEIQKTVLPIAKNDAGVLANANDIEEGSHQTGNLDETNFTAFRDTGGDPVQDAPCS
jgi:hypothetical protein